MHQNQSYYKQLTGKNQYSILLKSQGLYPFFDFKVYRDKLLLRISGLGRIRSNKDKKKESEKVEIYIAFKSHEQFLRWWDVLDTLLKSVEEVFYFIMRSREKSREVENKVEIKVEKQVEKEVERNGEKN